MPKRNVPALVANTRRAEQAGKTKRDIMDDYEKEWRRDAFCDMDGKEGACTHCGSLPDEECRG